MRELIRYYAVVTTYKKPHVIAEFTSAFDAMEFGVADSYSEEEMRQHPDLQAALERWQDPSDREYATAAITSDVLELQDHLDEALNSIESAKEVAQQTPEDPTCAALLKATDAIWEAVHAVADVRPQNVLGRWEGPRPELERKRKARLQAARERVEQAERDLADETQAIV